MRVILPGKKLNEFVDFLFILLYPEEEFKILRCNAVYLLKLSDEYLVDGLKSKIEAYYCRYVENFVIRCSQDKERIIEVLNVALEYKLKDTVSICIQKLSLFSKYI